MNGLINLADPAGEANSAPFNVDINSSRQRLNKFSGVDEFNYSRENGQESGANVSKRDFLIGHSDFFPIENHIANESMPNVDETRRLGAVEQFSKREFFN